jgi:DNA polymerase-3 subunit delta'
MKAHIENNMLYHWQIKDYSSIIKTINHGNQIILLFGDQGIGKKILAQELIKYLLCTMPAQNLPCGQCKSCILYINNNNPDFYIITDENSKIKLEVLKELLHKSLVNKPSIAQKKIVFIPDFAQISKQGANSLLKTLEEPQLSTIFIMIAQEKSLVLPTILSRCVTIRVHKPDIKEVQDYLKNYPQPENDNYNFWYKYFYQAPLASAILSNEQLNLIISCLLKPTITNIFATSSEFDGKKISFAIFVDFFYKWLCDLMQQSIQPSQTKDGLFTQYDRNELISKVNINKLFDLQDKLHIFTDFLNHPINNKLHIENILFNYQQCFNIK